MPSVAALAGAGSSQNVADALWATPGNITADDGANYAVTTPNQNLVSDGLRGSTFDFSAIPNDATITGVLVEIERRQSSGSGQVHDASLRLMVNGALAGDDKATATLYPTSDTIASYGGASDLWGNALTPALVKGGALFGAQLQVTRGASGISSTCRVDFMRITVYYTTAAPTVTTMWISTGIGSPAERWVERSAQVSDGGRAGGGTTVWI